MENETRDWKGNPGIACPECGEFIPVDDDEPAWPRPVPVSERLPEVDTHVQWFFISEDDWCYGRRVRFQDQGDEWFTPDESGQVFRIREHASHWLPAPPNPE